MSLEMYIAVSVALTLLSVALATVAVVAVVRLVRKSQMKKLQKTVKKLRVNEDLYIDFGRHISVAIKGFSVVDVIANGEEYASIAEVLVNEPIGAYRRRQLLKLEKELDQAYVMHTRQQTETVEVRHEEAVVEQELRKPKFVEVHNTGAIAGAVHVYKPCTFVLSDKLAAEIIELKGGYLTINKVFYAPEGNVRGAQLTVPINVLSEDGDDKSDQYKHYIENAPSNIFSQEKAAIDTILKNMMHYNDLLFKERLVFNGDKLVQVLPASMDEIKEESKKPNPKEEAKEKVEELVELEEVLPR